MEALGDLGVVQAAADQGQDVVLAAGELVAAQVDVGDGLMTRRRTGLPTVLASAVVGLPPLALVSLVAGASTQKRCEFAAVCLVGRTARFVALAVPAALALT